MTIQTVGVATPFDRIRQLEQENQVLKDYVDELESIVQSLMFDMSELADEYDIDDYSCMNKD